MNRVNNVLRKMSVGGIVFFAFFFVACSQTVSPLSTNSSSSSSTATELSSSSSTATELSSSSSTATELSSSSSTATELSSSSSTVTEPSSSSSTATELSSSSSTATELSSSSSTATKSSSSSSTATEPSSSSSTATEPLEIPLTPSSELESFFDNEIGGEQVFVKGVIVRLLSDDTDGDAHQRFIISLDNEQTLLIAHNIDIGTRVANIKLNQIIYVFGEYEWNAQGGVVHWTHKSVDSGHVPGFILYNGVQYD